MVDVERTRERTMPLNRMPIQQSVDDMQRKARNDSLVRVRELPGSMFGPAEERRCRDWFYQSLESVANRSGFDSREAVSVLVGIRPDSNTMDSDTAHRTLAALHTAFMRGRQVMRLGMERKLASQPAPAVLAYAQETLRTEIRGLLADPSDLPLPSSKQEPREVIGRFRDLAGQVGLDFDALLVEMGTEPQRARLADIEHGAV